MVSFSTPPSVPVHRESRSRRPRASWLLLAAAFFSLHSVAQIPASKRTAIPSAADGCTSGTALDPASTSLPEAGATAQTFQVQAPADCAWSATSNDPWLTITSGASASGNATVTFDAARNPGPARVGTISVAGLTFTVNQADGCAQGVTLDPAGTSVSSAGATALTFQVQIGAGCAWTAVSNDSWITVSSGAASSGPGTVSFDVAPNTGAARTGSITAAGLTFTVSQADGCAANSSLNPVSVNVGAAGASGQSLQVLTSPGCAWTASSNDGWITVVSGASGAGSGVVVYNVQPNPGPARAGSIVAAGQTFTVNQEDGCLAFTTLDPTRVEIPATGTPVQTFQVQTSAGCSWTAVSNDAWITVTGGGSGTGTASVTYSVAPNTARARTGTITAANRVFTVEQADGCSASITLEPASTTVASSGGSALSFQVQAVEGCSWTAATDEPWITISSGGQGAGAGTVVYGVAANTGPARSGSITVSGHVFAVNQSDGCGDHTTVNPASASLPASGASSQTFEVLTEDGCAWTAVSNAEWITIVAGDSGTRPGTVTYNVAANPGPERTGTVSVRGHVFTVSQEGGCAGRTSLVPDSADLPASGGTALSFQVQTEAGCAWTATSNTSWITLSEGASGTGPGTVHYSVSANAGAARTGTITVGAATFTIYQAEACGAPITLSPESADLPPEAATGLSFEVRAVPGCTWTARSNASWISVADGSSGSGNGIVVYNVAANSGPVRTGTITAGGQVFSVTQEAGCSAGATLIPSSASVTTEGAVGRSFQVSVPAGCEWTAASEVEWITVTAGANGSGTGIVTYNVSANSGPARTGTIIAGHRTFTVQQADGCAASTSLFPVSATVAASGATGQSFEVRIGAGCTWTAVSDSGWLTLTAGSAGTGNGSVTFNVAANAGPDRTGTITAAGRAFAVHQADLCSSNTTLTPAGTDVPAEGASNLTFQVQAPAGCPWTAASEAAWITVTSGTGTGNGTVRVNVAPNLGDARASRVLVDGHPFTVSQARWCGTPDTPRVTSHPTAPVIAGNSFTIGWEPVPNLPSTGYYQVNISKTADCASPTTVTTEDIFVTIPTADAETITYCVQVRAVMGPECAPGDHASGFSPAVTVVAQPLPPAFTVIQGLKPVSTADRSGPPPSGSTVVFRNIGDSPGTLSLAPEGGFFTVSPPTLTGIPPGGDATVTIVFNPESTATAGIKSGDLVGTWSTNDGARSVSTAITLTVLEGRAQSTAGIRLEVIGSSLVYFRQYRGNPTPQQVIVRNSGPVPVRIAPSIGPGGTWLSILGDFASPLPPYAERYFDLIVDRARRTTEDGPPPLSTTLRIENVDGNPDDAAVFAVFDEEPTPPVNGSNRPDEEASLILGSTVSTTSSAAASGKSQLLGEPTSKQYFSDGWIRNRGPDAVSVDLYFTPEGAEGLSDPRVKKNTITVQGYSSFRLSDFQKGLFGTNGSGHVEIRSNRLSQLSVRSTVESIGFKDGVPAQYGSDLPVLLAGQGVGTAAPGTPVERLLLSGLRGPLAGNRSNIILSETSGASLDVKLRLFNGSGLLLGQKTVTVQAYSKTQINSGDADLFPVPYSSGSLQVEPIAGKGTVSALATVIDNNSQSYSVRPGSVIAKPPTAKRAPNAVSTAFLPIVVQQKTADSYYTTRVTITNGADADATIQMTYLPDRGFGTPSAPVSVTIPRRDTSNSDGGPRAVAFEQVLKELLKIEDGSRGMFKVEGELGDLTFTTETSTPLDLNDAGAGRSISSLNPAPGADPRFPGVFSRDSQEIIGLKQSDTDPAKPEVSLPSIEENSQFRTHLILAELSGEKGRVRVLLRKPGGAALGDPTLIDIGPNERVQVDRVILAIAKPPGGSGDFKDIEIVVQAVDGKARTLALVSRVASDPKSKRVDTYVLGPAVSGSAKKGKK